MEELYNSYSNEKFINVLGEYAIYLRKSRTDMEAEARGEGETLVRHEKILLDLAKQKGIKIGKIYREIVSGETIEARPEVQKLLADVKKSIWKGILVVEVDRLARGDTEDQGTVAKAFKISNTKIITPMKTYDPNDEFDEEYFEFGLFMSRREYKTINRRLQRGRVSSVNEGKYVGSVAPYGYERVKIKGDKGYTLRKNSEANTVTGILSNIVYTTNAPLFSEESKVMVDNQEIIPTPLLLSIAGQRENVPFSAFIEAILMIFSFDILRESDLKMPNFANSSLSIVGALILGDAAVSAGIVSPIMIIVVAITSISSLAFSEPELINSLRWYRLIFMLGASFFGIYGLVLVGLYFLITIISTKSFTLPYLSPFAPINLSQLKDSIISYPIKKRKKRNNYLSNNIVKNKTEE